MSEAAWVDLPQSGDMLEFRDSYLGLVVSVFPDPFLGSIDIIVCTVLVGPCEREVELGEVGVQMRDVEINFLQRHTTLLFRRSSGRGD